MFITPTRALCLLSALSLSACNTDTTNTELESTGGAGAEVAGAEVAGAEVAGVEVAGAEVAGTEVAGTEVAGAEVAGAEVAGTEVEPPFCAEEPLVVKSTRGDIDPFPQYVGIDDRFESGLRIVQINMAGAARAGTYSLEGNTPEDCAVCAYIALNCGNNGCEEVYFATSGTAVVTEMGEGGGRLTGQLVEAGFEKLVNGALEAPSRQICFQEHSFDVPLPALLGDTVADFELQNCETGELESVTAKGEGQNGVWYIATAGWCPACRQLLNNIHDSNLDVLEQGRVTPMFVVTEDDSYGPASLEFCRAYGRRYASTSANFYLDANLEKTSSYMSLYVGDDGSFGLPWQAIFEGDTNELLHVDGSGTNGQAVLNELLNR